MRQVPSPDTFRQNVVAQFKKSTKLSKREAGNLERGILVFNKRCYIENVVKSGKSTLFRSMWTDSGQCGDIEQIVHRIDKKEMKARDVGKMSHQDLAPDKWKDLIQEKKKKMRIDMLLS